MKAIEFAWKENLKLEKDNQWLTKEEIIKNICPYEYGIKSHQFCKYEGEDIEECRRCWNRNIEEDDKVETTKTDNKELTFNNLYHSPINGINLNWNKEEYFKKGLERGEEGLVFIDDTKVKYDKVPVLIEWLQDVYDYCTELKNRVEYVDFNTALNHMKNGRKAKYENHTYSIVGYSFFIEEVGYSVSLTLKEIESKEWILL